MLERARVGWIAAAENFQDNALKRRRVLQAIYKMLPILGSPNWEECFIPFRLFFNLVLLLFIGRWLILNCPLRPGLRLLCSKSERKGEDMGRIHLLHAPGGAAHFPQQEGSANSSIETHEVQRNLLQHLLLHTQMGGICIDFGSREQTRYALSIPLVPHRTVQHDGFGSP